MFKKSLVAMFNCLASLFPLLWLSYAYAAEEGEQPVAISTTDIVLFIIACFALIVWFSWYQKGAHEEETEM